MIWAEKTIGYRCKQCSSLYKSSPGVCSRCGANAILPMYDHYQVLGLTPDTFSAQSLKKAFKRLSLEYHPDRNQDETAEDFFLIVSESYQVLSDPSKKAEFDRLRLSLLQVQDGESFRQNDFHSRYNEAYDSKTAEEMRQAYEHIFREFHRFRGSRNVRRPSNGSISGVIWAVLGFSIGVVTQSTSLFILTLLGYLMGRLLPQSGKIVLPILNFVVVVTSFIVVSRYVIMLPFVILLLLLYFPKSKEWRYHLNSETS